MKVYVSAEEWYPVPHVHRAPPRGAAIEDIPADVVNRFERAEEAFNAASEALWAAWEAAPIVGRQGAAEEGRTALWYVFEVLSAVFVVTGLLVAIYSDSQLIRAVAGVALIVVVAAATYAVMEDQ